MMAELRLLPCPNPFCGQDRGYANYAESFALWSIRCGRCGLQGPSKDTEAEAVTAWNTRPALSPTTGEALSGIADRIAEVMAEGDGSWSACTGCQESNEGSVSTTDYPYDPAFKCQPGGGCGECGGIGATWTPAGFYDGYAEFAQEHESARAAAALAPREGWQEEVGRAVEALGEKLFKLSALLPNSGFLNNDANHAAYEEVVAAWSALSRTGEMSRPNPSNQGDERGQPS